MCWREKLPIFRCACKQKAQAAEEKAQAAEEKAQAFREKAAMRATLESVRLRIDTAERAGVKQNLELERRVTPHARPNT